MAFTVEKLTPKDSGALRALASVRIGSVLLHDFRVVQEANKKAFVQPPLRQWVQNGKTHFGGPLVELPENVFAAVQDEVLKAFDAGAFTSAVEKPQVYSTSDVPGYKEPDPDTAENAARPALGAAAQTEYPTEKQLNFLRNLGYSGPAPNTKSEASALIEDFVERRKNRQLGF